MHVSPRPASADPPAARLLGLVCATILALCLSARAASWGAKREYRRRIEGASNANTVAFSFQGGGHLRSGGRSVLVVDAGGKVLPSRVVGHRRGGATWVAYQGSKARGQTWVYYGGSTAGGAPSGGWRPNLSLLLRTFPVPAGAFESHKPIAAASRGPDGYGMGFVNDINLGHNPYGPNDRFAAHVSGYLKIAKPGKYRIFTLSADASFVLLDGKPLCSWPGRHGHGGGRQGRYGADVTLKKNIYRLDYYYAEDKGEQVMSLGWTPPWPLSGKRKVELVPASAYLHTHVARVAEPERRDNAPLAAFHWRQVDQLLTEQHQYTRVRLTSQCRRLPKDAKAQWACGDGAVDKGTHNRDHIYVGDGPFTCALRLADPKGKTLDQYRSVIRPNVPMKNLTVLNEPQLRDYIDAIARADCRDATKATMTALWELVDIREDVRSIKPFCAQMVDKFGLSGLGWRAGDRLALAVSLTEPARAAALYAKLAAKAPTKFDAARMRIERIELVLHKLKDTDRAMALAKTLRASSTGWEARLGLVKIGDVHRANGDFAKAEAAYRAAAKVAYGATDRRLVAMRQGGYLETAETYIRDKFLRAARELLIRWEAHYPDGKLGGDLPLMTAKYFENLGAHQRALAELRTLTQMNPLSPYLPEIELRMARAHARLGDRAKANELYDKVMDEYPKSDAAQQARRERY